jgi:ribonuclease BN (tRNA processing enzyme)
MIDATPDFPKQFEILTKNSLNTFKGILLTHAHIGHYTGLIHLGREVLGTKSVPVYTMPKMKNYLESNGPWSQLVKLKNIELKMLVDRKPINLNHRINYENGELDESIDKKIPNINTIIKNLNFIKKTFNRQLKRETDRVKICMRQKILGYIDEYNSDIDRLLEGKTIKYSTIHTGSSKKSKRTKKKKRGGKGKSKSKSRGKSKRKKKLKKRR